MSSPPQGRGKGGSRTGTPSYALSPWSRAAPRNLTSASRRRCRMRRPVPCSRRQWAPFPLLGGLERDASGLGRDSGAGQAYFPPPEGAARLGLRTAPLPIPTAWSPTEEGDQSWVCPHLGPALASPSSQDLRGRHRAGGRRTCGDMSALSSCIISPVLSCRHLNRSRNLRESPATFPTSLPRL